MSFWNWLTGYDPENAQRAAAADAQLRRINQDAREAGRYDDLAWNKIESDYAGQESFDPATQEREISLAFDEGWAQGRQNVSNTVSGVFNRILADPLRAVVGGVPWWVWLGALVGLFAWLGGFRWLARISKGALK